MGTRLALDQNVAPWGLLTSLDLYECNPDIIRDCELLDMKPFGECQVVHFGQDERVAGYSMIQLIETSLISGHFANLTNAAYIDIFSCKPYDPEQVADFTKAFFKPRSVEVHTLERM
ncbi:MAG: S-adenosylmethionine decarboxylase [Deltaproteobacteria bacterium]|nr:S-adenosylmethionine decarboxylase [Deltaproteobacteria bacterium]